MTDNRRTAAERATLAPAAAPAVDVLHPTAGRRAGLAVTPAGPAAQDEPSFRVVLSDPSVEDRTTAVAAMVQTAHVLRAADRDVRLCLHRRQSFQRGMSA